MALGFFGQELGDDDDIEIVLHNPAVASWFAENAGRQAILRQYREQRNPTTAQRVIAIAKAGAKALGVVSTVIRAISINNAREETKEGETRTMVRRRPREPPDEGATEGLMRGTRGRGNPRGDALEDMAIDARGNMITEDPGLLDLIPENTEDPTAGMDIDMGGEAPVAAARMAAAGVGGAMQSVSKETPISIANPSYGLQETHTTILPWTGWFTVAGMTKTTPLQTKINMTGLYNFLDITLSTDPGAGAAFPTAGWYGFPANETPVRSAVAYPETIAGGGVAVTAERQAWREYWAVLYDYYTVIGCEYEIEIQNPQNSHGNDVMVGIQFDTYSDTATSTGNVMPQTNYSEMIAFKNIQWRRIACTRSEHTRNNIEVIKGTYRPGQAKRNIINDGDVKTWTKTDGSNPNLTETLTLNMFKHPMNYGNVQTVANVQITLKYIVQFKDLKQQARYPNTIITNQDITQILNENPASSGTALQKWTT